MNRYLNILLLVALVLAGAVILSTRPVQAAAADSGAVGPSTLNDVYTFQSFWNANDYKWYNDWETSSDADWRASHDYGRDYDRARSRDTRSCY